PDVLAAHDPPLSEHHRREAPEFLAREADHPLEQFLAAEMAGHGVPAALGGQGLDRGAQRRHQGPARLAAAAAVAAANLLNGLPKPDFGGAHGLLQGARRLTGTIGLPPGDRQGPVPPALPEPCGAPPRERADAPGAAPGASIRLGSTALRLKL